MQSRVSQAELPPRRTGITLVETMISVSLMTFAASALLTAVSSSVQVSTDNLHAAVANGLADQLMDEIAAVKFPTGSGSGSGASSNRSGFTDLDSYNGYNVSPPQARNGQVIGMDATTVNEVKTDRPQPFQPDPRLLSRYRQQVTVEKVAESGNTWVVVSQSSTLRRVTVTISYTDAQGKTTPLAVQVRVFSNVAVAP